PLIIIAYHVSSAALTVIESWGPTTSILFVPNALHSAYCSASGTLATKSSYAPKPNCSERCTYFRPNEPMGNMCESRPGNHSIFSNIQGPESDRNRLSWRNFNEMYVQAIPHLFFALFTAKI